MTNFKTLLGSAAALALCSGPALADVTAPQVWADWKAYMEQFGYEISADEAGSGSKLEVSNITMKMEIPETGGHLNVTMGDLSFTEIGDGSVAVSLPATSPFTMKSEGVPEMAMDIAMTLSQEGFTMIASGTPGDMKYIYGAARVALTTDRFDISVPDGDEVDVNALSFDISDMSGSSTVITDGELRKIDQTMTSGSMGYAIDMAGKDDNGPVAAKMDGQIASLDFKGSFALPQDAELDSQDPAAMVAAGFALIGGYSFGAGNGAFSFTGDGQTITGTTASEGGAFDVAMSEAGLRYGASGKGMKISATASQFPMPVDITIAESGFDLTMPLSTGGGQDFGLGIKLRDFTIPEFAYMMIDPGQQLPRDPATIDLAISGKANMFASLMDQKAMASGKTPGEVESTSIDRLQLKIAGAELTGNGAFTFDNSDKTTFDGMPAPDGSVDLKLTGGNGLLDKLVAIGILPEQQAMSARMMMGLFAVPGDGPDTLTSKIEVTKDGQVKANGQRLK